MFTEHTTTKQEKINILRRFDDVESLKESKSLYSSIKNELNTTTQNVVTESMEKKLVNHQVSGSSQNLIESKTYENPQFLRMKDIIKNTKIKINKLKKQKNTKMGALLCLSVGNIGLKHLKVIKEDTINKMG